MLNLATTMAGMMYQGDFNLIEDPLTAEDYQMLSSSDKLMLQLGWIQDEYMNNKSDYVHQRLKMYDKPLHKKVYRVFNKNTKVLECEEYESFYDLAKDNNITEHEARYLKRYSGDVLKNPKFPNQRKIAVIEEVYKLKGNTYKLESSN